MLSATATSLDEYPDTIPEGECMDSGEGDRVEEPKPSLRDTDGVSEIAGSFGAPTLLSAREHSGQISRLSNRMAVSASSALQNSQKDS